VDHHIPIAAQRKSRRLCVNTNGGLVTDAGLPLRGVRQACWFRGSASDDSNYRSETFPMVALKTCFTGNRFSSIGIA